MVLQPHASSCKRKQQKKKKKRKTAPHVVPAAAAHVNTERRGAAGHLEAGHAALPEWEPLTEPPGTEMQ